MPSGILAETPGDKDVEALMFLADAVGQWWNEKRAPDWGFSVRVSEQKIRECCDQGGALFSTGTFPDSPGPFKRLSTLIVLGRLFPFFQFKAGFAKNGTWQEGHAAPTGEEETAWVVRMMVLTIPFAFPKMVVSIDGKEQVLDEWNGFPSSHYRLEFMGWLRWLDGCEDFQPFFEKSPEKWTKFCSERLARMVMSTSLMLEACYYLSPVPDDHRARLLQSGYSGSKDLDEDLKIDLYYDTDAAITRAPKVE